MARWAELGRLARVTLDLAGAPSKPERRAAHTASESGMSGWAKTALAIFLGFPQEKNTALTMAKHSGCGEVVGTEVAHFTTTEQYLYPKYHRSR